MEKSGHLVNGSGWMPKVAAWRVAILRFGALWLNRMAKLIIAIYPSTSGSTVASREANPEREE